MWELQSFPSYRGNLVRRTIAYALAAIVAAFLWAIALAPTTHAAGATWSGNSIISNNNTYTSAPVSMVSDLGLLSGTVVYTYTDPAPRLIHVIYFASDVTVATAINAKYKTYSFTEPSSYTNPSDPIDLPISQQPTAAAVNVKGTSSCAETSGLGYVICPITRWLATGMDWIFHVLSGFLAVRPVDADQSPAMFRAWTYMRSIANVAFVLSFLIIIYSQLTSFGISNYGLKKLLPRLIIAAILVNVSYYICAVAIDISNILGYSLQDIFLQIRKTLVGTEGNNWNLTSWESTAGFVLSGGTAAIAGTSIAVMTIADVGIVGASILLLPALLTGLIAVIVALAIMAARQAIITILVIVSPLAFVAFLLPNTEKWFDKWRETFMTMLFLFPAFSFVFGGSQLASAAIIQNADSVSIVILGMLVQVAPLLITPLLIKLGGGLLGRVAGMVNDPNKGIIDRTRNWSKEKTDDIRAKRLGNPAGWAFLGAAQRNAQRRDHNRRKRADKRASHGIMADARWANSQDFSDIDQATRTAKERKELGESQSELRHVQSKVTDAEARQLDIRVRQVKLDVENAQLDAGIQNWGRNQASPVVTAKLRQRVLKDTESAIHKEQDADYDELKGGTVPASLSHAAGIITHTALARDALRRTRVATDRLANAQTVQQQDYVGLLQRDGAIALEAGGIRGEQGRLSVLASAKKAASKFLIDDIQNIQDTMDYDLATNNAALTDMFNSATTLSQRVAYTRAMSKNGGPGIAALREVITRYEAAAPAPADLLDFKELLGAQPGVMSAGKDIEFWLTNNRHGDDTPRAGQPRTLSEISEDNKTWTNMSATAFASQNITTQFYALDRLLDTDPAAYSSVINMLRGSETALAQLKQGLRENFAIYTDQEIESAAEQGVTLPQPGTRAPRRP